MMGIEALVPRPGTSKAAPGRKIYPYLLLAPKIVESRFRWTGRRTYDRGGERLPLSGGDHRRASRAVLAWRLSNTNDASGCSAGREEALFRFGKPAAFQLRSGPTFTAEAFTSKLVTAGVVISMDGRGRFMDNIFIERLWRSIKYEEVHHEAYADGCEARSGISSWMNFYNFQPSSGDEQPDADGGVARRHGQNRGGGEGCGYAASLGQRKRVAHLPTAEAAGGGWARGTRPSKTVRPFACPDFLSARRAWRRPLARR